MLDQTADPVARSQHRVSMRYARVAGALYLPLFLLGPFALLYTRATVIVPGDAAATADRIAAHDGLFRAASVAELIIPLLDIALALVFYVLLKPVNQPISLLAAFFRLASAVMGLVSAFTNFAVLLLLSDAGPSNAVQADQLHALALYLLNLHDYVLAIGLVAFAFHILIQGYLIQTSNLLPRIIGTLLIVASVGYLVNSLRTLLALDWASEVRTLLLLPAFVAEVSLGLWLVVKGVRPVPATHVRQS
jgi:hypothetical protein